MTSISSTSTPTISATIRSAIQSDGIDPILSPDNPDLLVMYTAEDISGTVLADETPNGRDGTLTDMSTSAGKIDATALDGNGTSSRVDFAVPTADINTGFCFTAWVKFNGSALGEVFMSKRSGGNALQFYMGQSVRIDCLHWGLTTTTTQRSFTPTTGIWYFVACSYDGAEVMLRVDSGTTTTTQVGTLDTSTDDIRLFEDWNGNFSNIQIDQVRLFKRGLTVAELDTINDEGL